MRQIYLLGCVFLLVLASPVHAEFVMSEMIIDFADNGPRQRDIEIINKDKSVQYIATEIYGVEHPTEPNEKRVLYTDPVKAGLMVTPNKMALPAEARKLMRFLVLSPQADADKIYRVAVKPVIQGIDETKQRVALKVLIGYEALVIVRPKGAKIDLVAERKGNSLTLTNEGNTNANLQSGQQCDATGGNCKDLNVARIYAGQSWKTTLPHMNGVVKFQVWDGSTLESMSY